MRASYVRPESIASRDNRVNVRRARFLVGAVVGALLWPAVAPAHPEFNPTRTNRYLKLTLLADEVRLVYSVLYGQGPASAALRAADLDANGKVDKDEAVKMAAGLRDQVLGGLTLTVDGHAVRPEFEAPSVGFLGGQDATEVAPNPFTVDLVARVRLASAPQHELTVDDTTTLPELGENEVRLEESPSTELVGSARGVLPSANASRETRFVFSGPRMSVIEDRAVSARWKARATTVPARDGRWLWLVGLVLGVVVLAAVWRLSTGKRRR